MKFSEYFAVFFSIFFMGLIITAPDVCSSGAKNGLYICADILVPALFPFAIPVLFIINTSLFKNARHKTDIVFILSLLGGYPIGAKLISELLKSGMTDKKTAQKMVLYCVNAGPSFIVLAIGRGIIRNTAVGYALLFAHIISAVILAVLFRPQKNEINPNGYLNIMPSPAENLVLSVGKAADATFSVCAFVVMFSVINAYLASFSTLFKPLKYILLLSEVTTAATRTNNVYVLSFLLGFSGLSIWAQVYSANAEIIEKPIKFILARVLHGTLSAIITFISVRILGINMPAISNNTRVHVGYFYSDSALGISLSIMVLLFIISISCKKYSGNVLKDML